MWSLYGMREWKWVQMVDVIWPRWPPCSYMVTTFKNLLFWNQKVDDHETWHAALVPRVLPNLFKWWPWVDLDLFYSTVKVGPHCFWIGKCLSCRFQETIEVCEVKVGTYSQINEYMMIYDNPRSMNCTRSLRFNIFKLFFLNKYMVVWSQISHGASMGCWMEICSNVLGHMTKMVSRPKYGKHLQKSTKMASRLKYGKRLQKSPSSESRSRWSWNLVYNIGYSGTIKFVQMMILSWLWPFLWHGQTVS